jgi:predicted RNase H-like nuclease (RuvC/YqgF family)
MSEPCSNCDALRKSVEALENSVGNLSREKSELEDENGKINREVGDAQDERDAAEEMAEDAGEAKDQAVADLRDEKARELAMLRRLEFSCSGLCPLCFGIVEHKTGCDLKLAIWRLDHEIVRAEYAD